MTSNGPMASSAAILRQYLVDDINSITVGTLGASISDDPDLNELQIIVTPGVETPRGVRAYKIDNELFYGYYSTDSDSIILEEHGRGVYKTAIVSHSISTNIQLAVVGDLIDQKDIYITRAGDSFLNEKPGIVLLKLGGTTPQDNPKMADRYSITVYGGQDTAEEIDVNYPDFVFAAVFERLDVAKNTRTTFGTLGSAILNSGQLIVDDSLRPSWPKIVMIAEINVV